MRVAQHGPLDVPASVRYRLSPDAFDQAAQAVEPELITGGVHRLYDAIRVRDQDIARFESEFALRSPGVGSGAGLG